MNSEKNDNSKMVSKQFFGEIAPEEPKECAIMTLINNMSDNLTNQLYDAKLKFADATLDIRHKWTMLKIDRTGNMLLLWILQQDLNTQCLTV